MGQAARDALLHCMALSAKNEEVGAFIGKNSDFCPVLATSLCGLYSSLPRHLPAHMVSDPSWHRLSSRDLESMPEVAAFLSSLGFCDAVVRRNTRLSSADSIW